MLTIPVTPMGKPRMTRSDRWKMRPAVLKYRKFADDLRLHFGARKFPVPFSCTFVIPMPNSWSKKKRALMNEAPHQAKPDIDNMLKAVFDSLLTEDSGVHTIIEVRKVWGEKGAIVFPSIRE